MQNNFDAIIVLGYRQKSREINLILKNRLDKAIEILGSNREAKIILSGGKVCLKEFSEAELMANYLKDRGIETKNIILEDESKDTLQSIKNSKKIIDKYQFKDIALITSDYHLKRASMIAKSLGINISAISAPALKNKKTIAPIKEFFKKIFDYLRIKFR